MLCRNLTPFEYFMIDEPWYLDRNPTIQRFYLCPILFAILSGQ